MSSYPGNSSLATAVKDRVVSTFNQTMALYNQGRTDEVIAGCNLILQMDPLFDPARKLLDQVRNPASPFERGDTGAGGDRMAEARQAMAARDFERVIQITTDILTNDLMNEDARMLSDEAREKMEAAPFVDQFVRKCQQHIESGNVAAARTDLEKARALDAAHPGIAQMESMIAGAESTPVSFDASSFVVETPAAAPSRGTAQASDFGFTFEEEKAQQPAGGFDSFSFDTPPAPEFSFDAPPPAEAAPAPKPGTEFDFSTASIETSPDDQKKIAQYLADGDQAFSSGDYQQAIDLWSRIFLIDVTNEAASERIEKAKLKRREIEQRLESILAAGIAAFDKQDFATAKTRFQEVLQGDPHNTQAQEYLERIETESSGAAAFPPPPPPSFQEDLDTAAADLDEPDFAPAGVAAAPAARKTAAPRAEAPAPRKSPALALAIVAAVILLGLAGWFFFGRSGDSGSASGTAVNTAALVNRASALGQEGKFAEAIAVLQEIKPGDAQYDTAIAMIADLQQKQRRAATTVGGRPADVVYAESVEAGRSAFGEQDYVAAKKAFDEAIRIKPLPPDLQSAYDTATQQVAKLENARRLFVERKYADAIANLEPLRAREPDNPNIRRMIIDARFNLGAQALRQDRIPEAIKHFEAVLQEDPDDELARRSRDLAQRYEGQPRDLLYRIYVKYLPLRQAAT